VSTIPTSIFFAEISQETGSHVETGYHSYILQQENRLVIDVKII
jgi:hypothetical protein